MKINRQIDQNHFIEQISKNLNHASENLRHFPKEHKIASFSAIETKIVNCIDFVKEYSANAYNLIKDFDREEKKKLNNRILNIKYRRTI